MKRIPFQWLILLTFFSPSSLLASDFLTEEDLFGEIPIVTNATHFQQKVSETPASVTIIDRRMIEASTAVDLVDLFRLVPGFQSYYVNANRPAVNYQVLGGEQPRRLEVKVDGRSVYESLFSAVGWETLGITLDDVDYIEVIRGPNAPAEGSNAFLGSINIVTKSPVLHGGLTFRSQVGSNQTRNGSLAYTGKIGNLSHRTSLQYRSNDGFGAFGNGAIQDDGETVSLGFRGLWTPDASDTVEFQLGVSDSEFGQGDDDDYVYRDHDYSYQFLNWSHFTESGNKFQVLLYHNLLKFSDSGEPFLLSELLGIPEEFFPGPLAGRPDISLITFIEDAESERWDLEVRSSFNIAKDIRGSVGIAGRYDRAASELLFSRSSSVSEESYRGYFNFEWKPSENFVLNGGIIGENNYVDSNSLSHRIAGNYSLTPNQTIRLATSKSLRVPTLIESGQQTIIRYDQDLILDAIIAADNRIQPEKLKNIELAYSWRTLNNHFNLDVKLFSEELTNIIDTRREEFVQEFDPRHRIGIRTNSTDLDVDGVELEASYTPDDKLFLRGTYTHMRLDGIRHRAVFPVDDFTVINNTAPKNSTSLLVNYRWENDLSVGLSLFYQSEAKFLRGDDLDSYTRVDMKVAKKWQIRKSELELSFIAQNLGSDYQEFFEANTFETKYILGLQLKVP